MVRVERCRSVRSSLAATSNARIDLRPGERPDLPGPRMTGRERLSPVLRAVETWRSRPVIKSENAQYWPLSSSLLAARGLIKPTFLISIPLRTADTQARKLPSQLRRPGEGGPSAAPLVQLSPL